MIRIPPCELTPEWLACAVFDRVQRHLGGPYHAMQGTGTHHLHDAMTQMILIVGSRNIPVPVESENAA
jgi:hypothetical protein